MYEFYLLLTIIGTVFFLFVFTEKIPVEYSYPSLLDYIADEKPRFGVSISLIYFYVMIYITLNIMYFTNGGVNDIVFLYSFLFFPSFYIGLILFSSFSNICWKLSNDE